ncbi:unnamed protein product [Dovyalis caffra]|uniref:UspA domain-containing protein n=1 Tax=Dovyalis caffra TaxID=77055 RepID=A0AAV1R9E7_9ROSI|nr:unnamed protein product [Dovyalis caffra]
MKALETLEENVEYNWKEVKLPSFIPVVPKPELDRETGERRRGRDILVAIDHGRKSKHAFDWALIHLCRLADTIHLVHAIPDLKNRLLYEATEGLLEKLAIEALQVAMVKTAARIVEGDPGKVICREADRLRPAAVVMGTRGFGLFQSLLQGSVGEYCFHNCKVPVIIVPGKGPPISLFYMARKRIQHEARDNPRTRGCSEDVRSLVVVGAEKVHQ